MTGIAIISILLVNFTGHLQAQEPRVLFVGDSQTAGFLGGLVTNHLKNNLNTARYDVYGVSASSPRHWSDKIEEENGEWLCQRRGRHNDQFPIALDSEYCHGKSSESAFEKLIARKYDLVLFQFLGNSAAFSEAYIKTKVKQLLGQLSGEDCVFITSPPHYYTLKKQNEKRRLVESYFLEAIGQRCEVVRGMSDKNLTGFAQVRGHYQKDKKHLSRLGAKAFFQQIKSYLP